jgi:hypothetical protein
MGGMARQRGAAIVELALVLPLFVGLLLFGVFLTDLLRLRLKLQEAARAAAWELTAHPLTDYAHQKNAAAFARARASVLDEVARRYADLDSVEPDGPRRGWVFELGPLQSELSDREAPLQDFKVTPQVEGFLAHAIATAYAGEGKALLRGWGFNPGGWSRATVRMTVRNRLLPPSWLRAGALHLQAHHDLVTDPWALPVGADATYRKGAKANGQLNTAPERREHGLRSQVRRMSYLGADDLLAHLSGIDQVRRFLVFDPRGTYVVAHNYDRDPAVRRRCNVEHRMDPAGLGRSGLVNQGARGVDLLDEGLQNCFDTAPFRDTHRNGDSLYRQLFLARGAYFMGCHQPMADDPTRATPLPGDHHDLPRGCGGGDAR